MALLFQKELVARNRIAALPFDEFFLVAIERGVVFAVTTIAIGLALDYSRTFAVADSHDHPFGNVQYREQIVAGGHMPAKTIGLGAVGDILDRHLFLERR